MMFWLIAGAMTAIAALVLVFAMRGSVASQLEHARWREQVRLAKKRITALRRAQADGELDAQLFAQEEAEIARPLLAMSSQQQLNRRLNLAWVLAPVLVLALSSVWLYDRYGAQEGLTLAAMQAQGIRTPTELRQALDVWQAWQDKRPKDVEGWLGLASAYSQGGQFEKAEAAWQATLRALNAQESPSELDEAYVYANLAQNRFNQNQQQFDAQVDLWMTKALELNPDSELALGLKGVQGFANEDWLQVIQAWNRLLPLLENANERQAITGALGQARQAFLASGGDANELAAIEGIGFDVSVTLAAPERVNLSDYPVMFVYARPVGSKMPLAIRRVLVNDLPMSVRVSSLDEMGTGVALTDFDQVELVARLSQSGSAAAQNGDWQSQPVVVDVVPDYQNVELLIDQQISN